MAELVSAIYLDIPSSSSSLYIWNQGSSLVTWYIGNWEPKNPKINIYELEDEGIPSLKLTFSPLKIGLPNRKVVFQPSIFRCKLLVSGMVFLQTICKPMNFWNCLVLSDEQMSNRCSFFRQMSNWVGVKHLPEKPLTWKNTPNHQVFVFARKLTTLIDFRPKILGI